MERQQLLFVVKLISIIDFQKSTAVVTEKLPLAAAGKNLHQYKYIR